MTRPRGPWTAAAVTLFLLGGCADATAVPAADSAESGPAASSPAAPTGDGLVLRVQREGGFAPADRQVGRLPMISVYADGRIISEGPQIDIYPAPALPNLQVQQTDPAVVADLAAEARTAGVRSGADFGRPGVADAPDTRITLVTARGTDTVTVPALTEAQPQDPQLTVPQRDARAKLAEFVDRLTGLPGEKGMPAARPYAPTAVAALAQPYTPAKDGLAAEPAVVDWPGPALPGARVSPALPLGCVTATGAEAKRVLAAAQRANQRTPWRSGGKMWQVQFRPLLPEENGCDDLTTAR